ncbi:MAG: TetR family transcriptional regulator [Burkholderiales bacterium]|nr:TetR family transcriptional regulator [Burkholderiales bacterium]
MARKRHEDALATRARLLDAAERVFRRRGVGHTSLAEVADAAGVTRGAIYWHFKDKADLFQALVRRVEMPINAALEEMSRASAADPLGAVRRLAVHALQGLAADRRTQAVFDVVFLRCEYTEELAPVRARQLGDRKDCLRRCEAAFERAIAKGELPAGTDARVAAQGLYALVTGLMRSWVETPGRFDLGAVAPKLVDVYIAGLKSDPPRRTPAPRKSAAGRVRRPQAA